MGRVNRRTGGRKGMYNILLTGALMVAAVMVAAALGTGVGDLEKTQVELRTRSLKAQHAMDAAQAYLDAALGLSFHQSCFDSLKKVDEKETRDQFSGRLAQGMVQQMGGYTRRGFSFGSVPVELPDTKKISVVMENEKATIAVDPLKLGVQVSSAERERLNAQGKGWKLAESVRVAQTAKPEKTMRSACGVFFEELMDAVRLVREREKAQQGIGAVLSRLEKLGVKQTLAGTATVEDCEQLKNEFQSGEEVVKAKDQAVQEINEEVRAAYGENVQFSLVPDAQVNSEFTAEFFVGDERSECDIHVRPPATASVSLSLTGKTAAYTETYPVFDNGITFSALTATTEMVFPEAGSANEEQGGKQ